MGSSEYYSKMREDYLDGIGKQLAERNNSREDDKISLLAEISSWLYILAMLQIDKKIEENYG